MLPKLHPPALRPGQTIAVVAPAGPVDITSLERACDRLSERGYRVRVPKDVGRRRGYLAGDDAARADEWNEAFADEAVRALFPARGGYGATRILDQIDYDLIRRHPKIVTGFSDCTALHAALGRRTGLVTFHSPHPIDGWGREAPPDAVTETTFWRAISAEAYRRDEQTGDGYVALSQAEAPGLTMRTPGVAEGRLVGGNLSLIAALVGTPYQWDLDGTILLLEEVGEPPYRIDRYLSQLRLAGKLAVLAGVVLGDFTDCQAEGGKPSLSLDTLWSDYFDPLGIPVLAGAPIGHARTNVTLPLGARVRLDAARRRLTVLENPVALEA